MILLVVGFTSMLMDVANQTSVPGWCVHACCAFGNRDVVIGDSHTLCPVVLTQIPPNHWCSHVSHFLFPSTRIIKRSMIGNYSFALSFLLLYSFFSVIRYRNLKKDLLYTLTISWRLFIHACILRMIFCHSSASRLNFQ